MRYTHEKSSSFICQACVTHLTTRQNRIEHLRSVHSKETGEQWGLYPKILSDNDHLITHIKRVHLKSGKMQYHLGSEIMSSPQSVAVHIKNVHCKLLSLKCKQCTKTFTEKVT